MYTIQLMTLADVDKVYNIEYQCFAPHHWTKAMFEHEINNNDYANYYLLCKADVVIGYIGVWHLFEDIEITNFAIAPDFRGQKLGQLLLKLVLLDKKNQGAKYAFLEVRVSNHIAQNLYRQVGFEVIDIRKKYYADNGEDAYVMKKTFKEGELI